MKLSECRKIFSESLEKIYSQREIDNIFFEVLNDRFSLTKTDLILDKTIEKQDWEQLHSILKRLQKDEPVQYILGKAYFYGLEFSVSPDCLIPRPETELLVDIALDLIQKKSFKKVLDIGTGSGCIPITIKHEISELEVSGIDVSTKALEIAKSNAKSNQTEINFRKHNILEGLILKDNYDIITCNPPYIRELEKEKMSINVLDYEPELALFVPDDNPFIFYKKVLSLSKNNLKKGGYLLFEINQYLAEELQKELSEMYPINIQLKNDLQNNPRVLIIQFKS